MLQVKGGCVMSSVLCMGHFYQLVPKPVQVIKRWMGASGPDFTFLLPNTGRAVSFVTWTTVAGKYMGFQLRSEAVQRCSF